MASEPTSDGGREGRGREKGDVCVGKRETKREREREREIKGDKEREKY